MKVGPVTAEFIVKGHDLDEILTDVTGRAKRFFGGYDVEITEVAVQKASGLSPNDDRILYIANVTAVAHPGGWIGGDDEDD